MHRRKRRPGRLPPSIPLERVRIYPALRGGNVDGMSEHLNNEDIDKCPSYINSSDFTITLKDGTTKTILKNPINPKFGPITSYNLIKDYKDPNTNKVSCIYSFSTPNGIPYYPEKL